MLRAPFHLRACALALIAGLSCGGSGSAQGPDRKPGDLVLEPARVRPDGSGASVERGRLFVPEDRDRRDSPLVEVAFARLRLPGAERRAPLFFLAGGPGDSGIATARSPLWRPILEISDVILIDQRGCGRSRPELSYSPSLADASRALGDTESAVREMAGAAREAADHFREAGVDVGAYTTVSIAQDIDDLRRALGYERIVLMGHSYGTHLGLEIVRRLGDRVDRFISVGTAGPGDMHRLPADLDAHVRELSELIKADPDVGRDVPDFAALVRSALEKVRARPLVVNVTDLNASLDVNVPVGEHGLRMILLRDLGDVTDLPVLPRLVHEVNRSETAVLRWFVQKRYEQMRKMQVMTLAVRGASGASEDRWAKIREQAPASLFGMARVLPPPEVSAALGVRDLGEAFRAPVSSQVPALFISGTLDANTPPSQAEAVRAGFPNSGHLIVENGGHEDLLTHSEVRETVLRFLRGEKPESARIPVPTLKFIPVRGPALGHPAIETND